MRRLTDQEGRKLQRLDLAGLNEGWKPDVRARDDVELDQLILVRPSPE